MSQSSRALHTEWVSLPVGDSPMEAYLARPADDSTGPWPGVLVFMEVFGVNSHIRGVTERLAAEGYVALAINYYHRTTPNLELAYTDADVAIGRQHKAKTTRQGILQDAQAAIDFLKQSPHVSPKERLGGIGFCFGGHAAYLAATLPEIQATASFYGGGIAISSPGGGSPTVSVTPQIHGEILCLFGETDPLIPQSETLVIEEALQNARISHTVVRYPGVGHGFFCNQRADYNAVAAADAWERVKSLFERQLKAVSVS